MANNIKIVPSSSIIEITGSDESQGLISRFDVSGSALNLNYITPTSNDSVEILKIKRKYPVDVEPGANSTISIGYYGKSKTTTDFLHGRESYTIQTTGSIGPDGVVAYKKSVKGRSGQIFTERKTPGIHEEFVLSDTENAETFIRRTYVMDGTTAGANQNTYLTLRHNEATAPPTTWIAMNTNESAQITVRVVGRAGGNGTRSRGFLLNAYADTLNAAGNIAGNYAIVNSIGQGDTAPPNNWNVQLQFVNDFGGNAVDYIRVQVFNNSVVNETIAWTAYVELLVDTSDGAVRYGGI